MRLKFSSAVVEDLEIAHYSDHAGQEFI